jgi:ubiquinone/menaquinone biosynthesis C-methylase UbiE
MLGWYSNEKSTNLSGNSEPWLKGYFADSHYGWDGVTYVRNFAELRTRDVALMALGEVQAKKILDVGCGDGTYAFVLSKLGAVVSGQDLSESAILRANAREYGENNTLKGKFVVGDANKILFESNSFDSVFSADFFEHISAEKKREVLKEIYRVLKPGGILVIKTPNLDYLKISIFFKRLCRLITLRSPMIFIAHTRDNPDNEHHGLTNFYEMRKELESVFFHSPFFHRCILQRKNLPLFISRALLRLGLMRFSEHLIISARKSIFVGISESL